MKRVGKSPNGDSMGRVQNRGPQPVTLLRPWKPRESAAFREWGQNTCPYLQIVTRILKVLHGSLNDSHMKIHRKSISTTHINISNRALDIVHVPCSSIFMEMFRLSGSNLCPRSFIERILEWPRERVPISNSLEFKSKTSNLTFFSRAPSGTQTWQTWQWTTHMIFY